MTKPKPTRGRRDPRPIEAIGTEYDSLVPDQLVSAELGVSTMTIWRWDNDEAEADDMAAIGWPPPVVYRRRNSAADRRSRPSRRTSSRGRRRSAGGSGARREEEAQAPGARRPRRSGDGPRGALVVVRPPPRRPLDGSSIKAAHDEGRLHGPFRTREETRADAFPDHKHTDAGVWNPAWERKQ